MANINPRKAVMTLFSSPNCAMSHCARLVIQEKGVAADIEYYDTNEPPEDLLELNPNGTSPTLIERELVLYDSRIIMEYLDERFPHPPLHQMDPVSRATARMLIKRIDQDWYRLLDEMLHSGEKKSARAKKMLKESLTAAAPVFQAHPYFMSDEYSLVDCALAPLLWRLPSLGVDLELLDKSISEYAGRIFVREAFQESLSPEENDMANSFK
ncbi:MAG: stringent starvation protein A [Methylococcaceae bacterium]|nr:stringent starvation protein A [Methylococcaceae bacterium]